MTMRIKDNGKYEWRKEQYETAAEELGENTKSKGIDQQNGDELNQEERVEKVRLDVTRAAMQRQRNIAESGVTDIQELFNGVIDEETASQLMHAATDAAGFDIVDGFTGDKLRVKRTEIDPAIQTVASSPPEAIPESEVATEKQSEAESGSESEPADATEGEDDDGDETDPHDEPGEPDDHAIEAEDEADEIEEDVDATMEKLEAGQRRAREENASEHAMTDGGTNDGAGDAAGASLGGETDPI